MEKKLKQGFFLCLAITMCFKVNSQDKIYFPLQNKSTASIYSGVICSSNQLFFTGAFTGKIKNQKSNVEALGDSDLFFLSVDINNKLNWVKTAGGVANDKHFISEYGKIAEKSNNNDIIVSGVFNHSAIFNKTTVLKSNGYTDIFLMCISGKGDIKWIRAFGGQGNESITDMVVNPVDNQVAISGILSTPYHFSRYAKGMDGSLPFLALFNDQGELVSLYEQNSDSLFRSQSVCFDDKSNIYWALNYSRPLKEVGNASALNQDCYIKKISPEGELIWDIAFGGSKYDEVIKVITDKQNKLIVTGTFREKLEIGKNVINAYGDSDIFIARFTADGKLIKVENFGGNGYDEVTNIGVTEKNDYIITGLFEEFIFDSIHHSFDRDAFIMITNEELQPVGFNTLKGPGMERLCSVSVSGSDCMVSGFFNDDIYYNEKKYSSKGEEDPLFIYFNIDHFKDRNKISSGNLAESFRVWPNPAREYINIDFNDKGNCESINILSSDGRILKTIGRKTLPCVINLSEFNKGVYILEITFSNQTFNRKIIIE